ncbi:MAG TPA: response regulator [Caldithrix abyssi]|uniref:histidine kinase n=1 Tax=Caldithrix abyssi TaxID=187145 RepID=A0A7V4WWL5_CALAY|nr:response regulator [Caldithrix abyssi]
MNITYRHKWFFLIWFILCFGSISDKIYAVPQKINVPGYEEKGLPLIRNYLPNEYGADDQNWAIIQDKRGIMYFGNNYGVLEYDGASWRLIPIPNEVVRSLAIDSDGCIYVGGHNEIGYLQPDSLGRLVYHSWVQQIPETERQFGHVWKALVHDNQIYFQSYSHIFRIRIHLQENGAPRISSIKIWRPETNFHLSFLVNGRYYVMQQNRGLFSIEGDRLQLVPDGDRLNRSTVFLMQPWSVKTNPDKATGNELILVYVKPSGFFLYDGKTFTPFKTETDVYLKKNILYMNSTFLPDGTLALGTIHGGLLLMNRNGKIIRIIDQQAGLADPTVYAAYPDKNGALWLALQNGIARINYNLPFTLFDERLGIDSEVNSIIRFKGRLYCATIRGLRVLAPAMKPGGAPRFKKIPGIDLQSWSLLKAKKLLLAASTDGVAEVRNERANLVSTSWHNALSLFQSKRDSNTVYVGLLDGLAMLKFRKSFWQDGGRIAGISEDVRYITEDHSGNLWLGTMLQKVIKLTPQPGGSFRINRYDLGGQIKNAYSLFNISNRIIAATQKGFMRYNPQSDRFMPDAKFPIHYRDNIRRFFQAATDNEKRIWIQEETMDRSRIYLLKNGMLKPLPLLQLAGDRKLGRRIYHDTLQPDVFWFGGSKKLVRFIYSPRDSTPEPAKNIVLLRKITLNNDSLLFGGTGKPQTINALPFKSNTLTFEFALPGAVGEAEVRYQYLLEGFNTGWSAWTSRNIKTFEQLPPGSYIFRVRARDGSGRVSRPVSFSFQINPPWYQAWWAYTLYLLLLILIIYTTLRSRLLFLERKAKKLETLVAERTQKIREQAEKLKEMDRLKSRFFANITHEFRTPLTLIMGQVESVLKSGIAEGEQAKLKMASRNTRRLQQLINQLLDLSKIEVQSLKLKRAPHELVRFLRGMVFSFESLAKQKMIRLNFYSEPENIILEFDSEKMEEVFENLLFNALKFTPPGGAVSVTIQIAEREKEELNNPAGKWAVIHVKDTGTGIAADKLPHIFDRFYQADSSKTRAYEGTGLGLALVKELVELHQGRVTVKSEPGLGTDFTVLLPLSERQEPIQKADTEDYQPKGITVLSNGTEQRQELSGERNTEKQTEMVLIIEDNSDMRAYLRQNLESRFRIREAENGKRGLQRAMEIMPDLIISDVMMPEMDGFELVSKLKKDEKTSHIPVILLTARASIDDKIDGIESGADAYLSKPFNQQELLARANNLIRTRRQLRERFSKATVIKPSEISAVSADQAFLEKVINIIETHIGDESFSVDILAAEAAFSTTHLNRKLRALIDQSAGQLIRSMRLQRAADLLLQKAGNVAEIAMQVGFSDQSSFTRSFKKQFGCPPGAYHKRS